MSEPESLLKDFKVYIMTWNVVCRGPIEDLGAALGLDCGAPSESLPDLYAVGFQEVSARPQCLLRQAFFEEPWIQAVRAALHKHRYVKVKHVRLQGLVLAIFVKRRHLVYVRGIQSTYTRTGLGGVWGNKGGVTIRMIMYGCSLCFVDCHLAAHESELPQRVNEYNTIIDKQTFDDVHANNILNHDYSFWFGDLNFRVDDYTLDDMKASIEDGTVHNMLDQDQLLKVKTSGQAFHHFEEHNITFLPTYKYLIDIVGYNFARRKPAWTDRILYRCTENAHDDVGLDVTQHSYNSHDLYIQSDHKPVSGCFTIKVFAKPEQPIVFFFPVGPWTASQDCIAWYYTSPDTQVRPSDWVALYRDNFTSLGDHVCFVWASTHPVEKLPPHLMTHAKRRFSACQNHSRALTAHTTWSTPERQREKDRTRHSRTTHRRGSRASVGSPSWVPNELASEQQDPSLRRKGSRPLLTSGPKADVKSVCDEADKMDDITLNRPSPWVLATHSCTLLDDDDPRHSSGPLFYRVLFGSQNLLLVGKYRLLYLRGDSDVLGMSGSFKVKTPVVF